MRGQKNNMYESMMGLGLGMGRPGHLDRIASGELDQLKFDLNLNCLYTEPQDGGNIS